MSGGKAMSLERGTQNQDAGRSRDSTRRYPPCTMLSFPDMRCNRKVSSSPSGNQHDAFRTLDPCELIDARRVIQSADIKRCARSGPDYLEPKKLPAELKELSWTESATLGYKHTIWIQRILPANRDRALGYKMKQPQIVNTLFTLKTKRRKMKHLQIVNTLITHKSKRRKRVSSDPNYTSDHDNS